MKRGIIFFALLAVVQSKLIDLSCKQITEFVDGHNNRRLRLAKGQVPNQPAASDMKLMMWDNELAEKAAYWASKHKFGHNPNKKIGSARFGTGENIYMFSTTNYNFNFRPDMALEAWFNEYKDYKYRALRPSDFNRSTGVQIGHYTQMAWSNTTYVGCALSQKIQNGWKKFYVVCNYGPSGNYLNETPYRTGRSSGTLVCGTRDCTRPYGDACTL